MYAPASRFLYTAKAHAEVLVIFRVSQFRGSHPLSSANTAVSANVTPNSGVPGAETVAVVNPFGYSSPRGAAVSFTMQAEDSDSARALTFTATGLPPGITIAANGTISGSASTLGTYTVTVTATDTEGVSGTARVSRRRHQGGSRRAGVSPAPVPVLVTAATAENAETLASRGDVEGNVGRLAIALAPLRWTPECQGWWTCIDRSGCRDNPRS